MASKHPPVPIGSYQYAVCRGPIRHRWEAVGPIADRRRIKPFGTEATFRCENCGTIKILLVSRITGETISSPQYKHPDGYRTEQHDGAYWRAAYFDEIANDLLFNREDDPK